MTVDPSRGPPLAKDDPTLPLPPGPVPPLASGAAPGEAETLPPERDHDHDSDPATVATGAGSAPRPKTRVLGPYTLLRLLGRGGMGAVWEAVDFRLDRRVALKEMLAETSPEGVERFRREALNSARLRHPNIVAVHDVGSDDGRQYLVMDLVQGVTLGEALRAGRWSYRDKAALLEKICRAVQYAHEQGVVHRDLKPANIMLDRSRASPALADEGPTVTHPIGEPVVMDFGLAKDTTSDSTLSRSGQAMGTPSYMPPEQAEGRLDEVSPRSDVYSLGAILYEMLTGRPPFTGESVMQVLRAVLHDDPVPPSRISPDVSRDLETICLTCLTKVPERRYASAAALADDLRAWLSGDSISARPATWVERGIKRARRHRAAYATAAAAIAILIGSSGAFVWKLSAERDAALRSEERAREALTESNASRAQASRAERVRRDEEARRRALEAEAEAASRREWRLVLADDFSDPAATARAWRLSSDTATVANGVLRTTASAPCVLILRQRISGDVRLEWDCRFEGQDLDDLSCFLSADDTAPETRMPSSGYELKCGAYGDTKDMLLRAGAELFVAARHSLESGHTYHARAERLGRHVSLVVDERVVFDVEDPSPEPDQRHATLGLTAWHANATWDNVRIYSLGTPLKADMLEIADKQLAAGHAATAADLYAEVLKSASDETRKAAAHAGIQHTRWLGEIEGYRSSLAAAWPGVEFVIEDAGNGTARLVCDNQGVSDVSPLVGMRIGDLSLSNNHISDPSPLTWLPLWRLKIDGNSGLDLRRLAGMPLAMLDIGNCGIHDLGPLRGMPLAALFCAKNPLTSIAALHGMPLKRLDMEYSQVDSIEPLRGAPIDRLSISHTEIASLEPLRGMRLTELFADGTRVVDLAPLQGMPLVTLGLCETAIEDLSLLAGMPLTDLRLGHSHVRDLGPLRTLGLRNLSIDNTLVVDYAPLAELPLQVLVIGPFGDGRTYAGMDQLRRSRSLLQIGTCAADWNVAVVWQATEFWRKYDAGEIGTREKGVEGPPRE